MQKYKRIVEYDKIVFDDYRVKSLKGILFIPLVRLIFGTIILILSPVIIITEIIIYYKTRKIYYLWVKK